MKALNETDVVFLDVGRARDRKARVRNMTCAEAEGNGCVVRSSASLSLESCGVSNLPRDEKIKLVLSSVLQYVGECGPAGVSIADIANELGTVPQNIYARLNMLERGGIVHVHRSRNDGASEAKNYVTLKRFANSTNFEITDPELCATDTVMSVLNSDVLAAGNGSDDTDRGGGAVGLSGDALVHLIWGARTPTIEPELKRFEACVKSIKKLVTSNGPLTVGQNGPRPCVYKKKPSGCMGERMLMFQEKGNDGGGGGADVLALKTKDNCFLGMNVSSTGTSTFKRIVSEKVLPWPACNFSMERQAAFVLRHGGEAGVEKSLLLKILGLHADDPGAKRLLWRLKTDGICVERRLAGYNPVTGGEMVSKRAVLYSSVCVDGEKAVANAEPEKAPRQDVAEAHPRLLERLFARFRLRRARCLHLALQPILTRGHVTQHFTIHELVAHMPIDKFVSEFVDLHGILNAGKQGTTPERFEAVVAEEVRRRGALGYPISSLPRQERDYVLFPFKKKGVMRKKRSQVMAYAAAKRALKRQRGDDLPAPNRKLVAIRSKINPEYISCDSSGEEDERADAEDKPRKASVIKWEKNVLKSTFHPGIVDAINSLLLAKVLHREETGMYRINGSMVPWGAEAIVGFWEHAGNKPYNEELLGPRPAWVGADGEKTSVAGKDGGGTASLIVREGPMLEMPTTLHTQAGIEPPPREEEETLVSAEENAPKRQRFESKPSQFKFPESFGSESINRDKIRVVERQLRGIASGRLETALVRGEGEPEEGQLYPFSVEIVRGDEEDDITNMGKTAFEKLLLNQLRNYPSCTIKSIKRRVAAMGYGTQRLQNLLSSLTKLVAGGIVERIEAGNEFYYNLALSN
jgi:hypothetical protein